MKDQELIQRLKQLKTHSQHLEILSENYVVTADNYLKMCLIYLRVQSRVPVVIMGETGCGKTSLITFFCKNVLQDRLEVFNIHAGITTKMIIEKMESYKMIANYGLNEKQNLWIFFDEFNTSENLGLICEILTDRKLLGESLPENMIFLAACNPYKLRSKKIKFDENVGIKRSNARSRVAQNMLLYTVHPLPENVIESVWDFGALTDNDQRRYIQEMVTKAKVQNIEMITEMLVAAHRYFKRNEDSSSVSLRDVSRFIILYKWFVQSLFDKKIIANQSQDEHLRNKQRYRENLAKFYLKVEDYLVMGDSQRDLKATILAICHCYYLRISSLPERRKFLNQISSAQTQMRDFTTLEIEEMLELEQNDYICRMELTPDIAVNQALKENIFAIIPCIINKIPIFICGKPGCSKSLAITLIFANLRGSKSVDSYFKTIEEFVMVSFQGSDSCTSEGIEMAYQKAKARKKQNLLPVFVFDEIGLAELSNYNPLKVLHSLLEVENREIGFVGISNWRLDASKMNRALYLARPDPCEQDIKFTAKCIFNQICPGMDVHHNLIENLASAYSDLKLHFKAKMPEYQDFYGLRDFYHLIKIVSRKIANGANMNREQLIQNVKISIERNFGGKLKAAKILGKNFAQKQGFDDKYSFISPTPARELIRMNLEDRDARYLMLIGNPDVLTYFMERIFRDLIQDSRIMVGSNLESDLNKEDYAFKSLNDIILYVEKGIPIILKGKDHIYSSLYDLFNQNFAVYGNKRYCRIALGAQMNPQCFVHDEFRCVIFMNDDEESLKRADAPFLNRFEKHYVSLEIKDDEHMKYVFDTINENWIKVLLRSKMEEKQKILLSPTSIFPNFSDDNLGLIIQNSFEQLSDELEDVNIQLQKVLLDVKCQLIALATQDIVILAQISKIPDDEKEFIINKYNEIHNQGFLPRLKEFIEGAQSIESNTSNKLLAFTYSVNFDLTSFEGLKRYIQRDKITIRGISNFKSEQELIKQLQKFYQSETQTVQILEGTFVNDKKHIAFVKFIVDKVEKEIIDGEGWNGTKTLIILMHMQRNNPEGAKSSIPLFAGWDQKVYYDIQEKQVSLIGDLLLKNTKQIIKESTFIDFNSVISQITEKCLLKLNYDGELEESQKNLINENMFFIIDKLTNHEPLITLFKTKIHKSIEEEQRVVAWRELICCTGDIFHHSINVEMALKFVIETNIEKYLTILLWQIEKHSAFKSYFTCKGLEQEEFIVKVWTEEFNIINTNMIQPQILNQSNYTQFIAALEFPFSRKEAEILKEIAIMTTKHDESDESQAGLKTPLEFFTQQLNEKSRFRAHLNHMRTETMLQEIYINDIVKIFLIDYRLNPDYLNIVLIIIRKIMQDNTDFYEKIYTFLKNKFVFFQICQALDQFIQLKGDLMGSTIQSIEESFKSALEELQFERWEEMLEYVIDNEIINGCYPQIESLNKLKNEENLGHVFENFFCTLRGIINYIPIKKLSIVKFWSDFVSLAAQMDGQYKHFMWQIAGQVKQMENEDDDGSSLNFLLDDDLIAEIFTFFDQKINSKEERVIKFVCSLYTILLDLNPKYVESFVMKIEQPGQISEALFKYSSSLFNKIYESSGISDSISQFFMAVPADAEIEFHCDLLQNETIDIIEDLLSRITIQKFRVSLGDCIVKESQDVINNDCIHFLLPEFIASLKFVVEYDPLNEQTYPNTKLLIAHSRIKLFIDIYADIIYQIDRVADFKESQEIQEAMDRVTEELCVTDKLAVRTLQLYCLKVLIINKYSMSIPQFKQHINASQLPQRFIWMLNNEFLIVDGEESSESNIDVLPTQLRAEEEQKAHEFSLQSKALADKEQELKKIIENNVININAQMRELLKNKLKVIDTVQDRIIVGYAFMKACYINFSKAGYVYNEAFSTFFTEEVEEILEIKLGREYSLLLRHFVQNFPDRTILKMHSLTDNFKSEDANKLILMCSILILTYSFAKFGSPQSSQFFRHEENGVFSLQNLSNHFLCGQEYSERMKFFFVVQQNFTTLNHRNNGNYQCSAQCEYIYFVANCGWMDHRAEEAGKVFSGRSICPWCNSPISGVKSGQEANYRHIKMADAAAKTYVDQKVAQYEQMQIPGYYSVDAPDNLGKTSYYNLNPLTWRFLRLLINVPLYHIQLQGEQVTQLTSILGQAKLDNLGKQAKGYLEMHVKNDIDIFFSQIQSSGQNQVAPWLFKIFGDFQDLLIQKVGQMTTSFQLLKEFQNQVDQQVFTQAKINNFAQVANEFKSLIRNYTSSERSQALGLLDESYKDEVSYPDLSLYRLTRLINYEELVQSFYNNQANQHKYPVLHLCIEHSESFQMLSKFYPIIDFTNYLIKKLNLTLKRDEARTMRIAQLFDDPEDGQHIKTLWDRFVVAWNSLNFQGPLQFGCQVNTFIKYNQDSTLNYFLVDDKEKEGGMCMAAAMQQLAMMQSYLLQTLINAYSMQKELDEKFIIDTHQHPVQKLQAKHILDVNVNNYNIIQGCTLNKTEYGQGQQIIYDFSRIELSMLLKILEKKFMNTEEFEFIQYQLEILTKQAGKANFVTEIRQHIKQEPFSKEQLNYLNQYLESISVERSQKIRELQKLHSGLERIMCFLQNSKENKDHTLEMFCHKIQGKIETIFQDKRAPFYEVKLKNVIALYEIFEVRYFPHITQHLRPEYFNKKDDIYVRDQLDTLLKYSLLVTQGGLAKTEDELIPSGEKIQNAVLRFMIRCLAGELNHKEGLKTYIIPSKEDIWDEDVLERQTQLQNFVERMPENIKLSSIHSAYIFIQEWNTRQQQMQRLVGPVMEEVKQDQIPGDGAPGQAIVKPTTSFKPAPSKAAASKTAAEFQKALFNKKKEGKKDPV